MTKYFIIAALVILSVVVLVGCTRGSAVLDKTKTYEVTSDIRSLNVEINAAEFTIEEADEFSVESNLKNLTVTEKDGVLNIVDKTKLSATYIDAELKLYIPKDVTFDVANIVTGAGELSCETFSADSFTLKAGAGKVEFDRLEVAENISIKGGAGEISIDNGTLNNLTLDLGAGKLDMTAQLLGDSDLRFGVGKSDVTLVGDKGDYQLNIVNGVGKITVDGTSASAFANSGNGENIVNIKGGVGGTNIAFK